MRVTFVLPHAGLSGGARVLAKFAAGLHRRRHDVAVISLPQPRLGLRGKLRSVVRGTGWPRDPEPEPSYFDDTAVPHRVLGSERPITDADVPDADIVLATYWRTAPWVAALSPVKGMKAILLQGYETSQGREEPAMDEAWRLPLHKIVISKWLKELARDRFDDSEVRLVPVGVDLEQFNAPGRGKRAAPTVGLLYSTAHLKGNDVSIMALERLRGQVRGLHVIAFGAQPISTTIPLPDWVEFHYRPHQNEIPQLYRRCDVWLCASRREGFHLPPLEAMACRCPVVSTRVGGPQDIIEEGVNGFLVDVDDTTGLADRLSRVLSLAEPEWQRMSDAALATAARYNWEHATDVLENTLRDIVGGVSGIVGRAPRLRVD
jgi:glycosyltransferase involved in cell wall biosynthesis